MTDVMSPAIVRERLARQIERASRAQVADVEDRYTFVRPLLGAANDLIDWMSNLDNRLMFGLPDIDAAIRGIARGELCYLTGRAHSGKTQVVLNMVHHNPKGRFLYFTPDEVDNLVLTKLIAIEHGVSADRLEALMRAGDTAARNLAYTTSTEKYPNLVIIDQALTFDQMTVALAEAQDWWQAPCDGVIIDYLDLLPGDADYNGTKGKSTRLKRWTKQNRVATVCIHQPKRGGAQRGRFIGMDDMAQGGETEATFVLGVYRRREDPYAADDYVAMHQNSITVAIDKNKRPPCHVGEFDYYMNPSTGGIRPLEPGDLAAPGIPIFTLAEAHGLARNRQVIDLAEHRPA
jgi:replicative DNA helicase